MVESIQILAELFTNEGAPLVWAWLGLQAGGLILAAVFGWSIFFRRHKR